MRLQTKFAILVGLLVVTVCVSLGASLWAVRMLQKEITEPLSATAGVLQILGGIKSELLFQQKTMEIGFRTAEKKSVSSSLERTDTYMQKLNKIPVLRQRSGISTSQNLLSRLEHVENSVWKIHDGADSAKDISGLLVSQEIPACLSLIDRIENRVLSDSELALEYGRILRHRLLNIVIITTAGAVLVGILALLLLRRWVISPVRRLRVAAGEIARGNFAYRLPVSGGDEVSALSAEINHMSSMIDRMQKEIVEKERLAATGEMLRRVAHNLRNPLSGIRGLAEITSGEPGNVEEVQENQKRIIGAVDRLEQWLADLLSATSSLDVDLRQHEVAPWLKGIISSHLPMAKSAGIDLEMDISQAPQVACFDKVQLGHAVVALVTNAIQATPEGGRVRLSARNEGQGWCVCVADDGSGIDNSLRERIFKPYFTTKKHGNGIGLAVAKQVVRLHGGEIEVIGNGLAGAGTSEREQKLSPEHFPEESEKEDNPTVHRNDLENLMLNGAMFVIHLPGTWSGGSDNPKYAES